VLNALRDGAAKELSVERDPPSQYDIARARQKLR
jgi:hypothetical protein